MNLIRKFFEKYFSSYLETEKMLNQGGANSSGNDYTSRNGGTQNQNVRYIYRKTSFYQDDHCEEEEVSFSINFIILFSIKIFFVIK